MVYIAPDYSLRILNSHPRYVGLQFHKAFRQIFKMPKWVDGGLHYGRAVPHGYTWKGQTKFEVQLQPSPHPNEFPFHADANGTAADNLYNACDPFIPLYGFQDTFHKMKSLIITSDLPSCGEISMDAAAAYRILSDFAFSPSTGLIETSASKKSYLNSDSNFISEVPPGNVTYFCANGTHGRLI